MVCSKCGKDYPKKIWQIHSTLCDEGLEIIDMSCPYENMDIEDMRNLAKERGVSNYWNRTRDSLEIQLTKGDAE